MLAEALAAIVWARFAALMKAEVWPDLSDEPWRRRVRMDAEARRLRRGGGEAMTTTTMERGVSERAKERSLDELARTASAS
jgi:hypothetical protein